MNVINFNYDVPLEQTMIFESIYHEAEQLELSEKKKIRTRQAQFLCGCLWMESLRVKPMESRLQVPLQD